MTEALVIPFIKPPEPVVPEPICSFCRRPEKAVSSLVVSSLSTAAICGDCARHAKTRMEEEK